MSKIVRGDLVEVIAECHPSGLMGVVSNVHDVIAGHGGISCRTCGNDEFGPLVVITALCPGCGSTHEGPYPMRMVRKIEPPTQKADRKEAQPYEA